MTIKWHYLIFPYNLVRTKILCCLLTAIACILYMKSK